MVLDAVDRKKVAGTGGQLWQLSNEQENSEPLPVILYCNHALTQIHPNTLDIFRRPV